MTRSDASKSVTFFEMGARDGLQNERTLVSTADKVRYIDLLSESGLTLDRSDVVRLARKRFRSSPTRPRCFSRIRKAPGVRYPVLVPNLKGYDRARAAGADAIAVFTAASESFHEAQHQHDDRRVAARRSRDVVARGKARRHVGARLRVDGVRFARSATPVTPEMVVRRQREADGDGLRRALDRRHDRRRRAQPGRRA